jgi:TPR repeat protein
MMTFFKPCVLPAVLIFFWAGIPPTNLRAEDQLEQQIRQLAQQGDAEAQFSLGLQYDTGNGEQHDPEQAFYWFSRAARQGIAGACLYLGMKYEFGTGVGRDLLQAQHWYEQAAGQGWPQAAFMLASLYLNNEPARRIPGCAWITIAGEQGFPGAVEIRKQHCLDLSPSDARQVEERISTIKTTLFP